VVPFYRWRIFLYIKIFKLIKKENFLKNILNFKNQKFPQIIHFGHVYDYAWSLNIIFSFFANILVAFLMVC